ncbi:MAG TPA: hypothetical protein VD838_19045, partial [Anaeromyxobacteraceae bacterium]|nr:hypothetical protein [Anaeromyxobacteraceae bacterium]
MNRSRGRLGDGLRRRGRDGGERGGSRDGSPDRDDHVTGRDHRRRSQLRDDRLRLAVGQAEETGQHLLLVLGA